VTDIAQSLAAASKRHQAGDVAGAESEYRKILAADPNHAAARHLLGVALHQSGRHAEAIDEITRAIELDPSNATFHNHLGIVHDAAGHAFEAEQSYRAALAINPHDPEVHFNLASLLRKQSHDAAAIEHYREALRLRPDYAPAHYNFGNLLLDQDQLAQAADHYRLAVRADPRHVNAWSNLGSLARRQQHFDEAAECFHRVLDLDAQHAEARYGLGSVLQSQGRSEESLEHLLRALELKPDHAEARNNLGCALLALGRLDEAIESFRRAVAARPDFAEAHSGLGAALYLQGLHAEALASFGRAIELNPEFAQARLNRSFIWLIHGDFARGWPEHEWRLKRPNESVPRLSQPRWDGSRLDGRTILLYAEQGLGDTLQFIRYVPLVQRLGPRVLVCVPSVLVPLLRQSGIEDLFPERAQLPPFDVHAPLLSLPEILRTRLDSIPADVPYLHADPNLVERWRPAVERLAGFRVGIIWQGNPAHNLDRYRSIPLVEFAAIAKVAGVQLISLQRMQGMEQIGQLSGQFDVADLADEVGTGAGALMDTAAIMRNLDLVITTDTATAHLAGALGVPVWVALPFTPDWRWLMGRDDSPWYPTMRLFRQSRLGDWADVFERIAAELQSMLKANVQPR
jgi:tetratricopeptide (TPR) repeat protein